MLKNNKRKQTTNNRKITEALEAAECLFCTTKTSPSCLDVLKLKRFISDRGRILHSSRSGACSRHQRAITKEIKKARFLALIPYTDKHAI